MACVELSFRLLRNVNNKFFNIRNMKFNIILVTAIIESILFQFYSEIYKTS